MRSPSAADSRSPVSARPLRQPVDPEPAVGIEHHLDDVRIVEQPAMAGPSAVRSMRAPREIASVDDETHHHGRRPHGDRIVRWRWS